MTESWSSMDSGKLVAIVLAEKFGYPAKCVSFVEAVAGCGLRGDRYFTTDRRQGDYEDSEEVTLIEIEAIERLCTRLGVPVDPSLPRRNLVTEHVSLNELVGEDFVVGVVMLRGIELCHPCKYLEEQTVPGIIRELRGRGGLRARIVRGGLLRVGDPIVRMGRSDSII